MVSSGLSEGRRCKKAFVESKLDIQSADVTLKMRPRSPKYNLLTIPMIQYVKFGQNPSFGSRECANKLFSSNFANVLV